MLNFFFNSGKKETENKFTTKKIFEKISNILKNFFCGESFLSELFLRGGGGSADLYLGQGRIFFDKKML